ncbi:hypothetical protein V1264_021919 [Littorina saxatilis]|uniref:Uncharacterized protein n=1 Tax=Littorina saxatilis TaxID=31220 RepID=A0AAN9AJ65_9CAEN
MTLSKSCVFCVQTESKIQVEWPKQHAVGKYDKPYVITATGQTAAEEVFGTPLPPCEQGTGGDSGYVFIPTGDGGVEVHSPPPVYWPEPHPRPPTPQHYASSKASLCSSEGIADRKKLQEEYRQQVLKQQEEKKKLVERQQRFEKLLRQQQQRQPRPPSSASGRSEASTFRRERVKSATTHRTKPGIPQRPVFSARPASDTVICAQGVHHKGKSPALHHSALCQQDLMHLGKTITELELHRMQEEQQEEALRPQQPMNPLSLSPSLEDLMIADDRSPSPDNQEAVDKYGWRAQVHGDPHNIKKTTKRLPYTVKCAEPSVAPEPPKVHMECRETFFYNTIPRRKANFDVHQEWLSETLHAKRIELQKREGVNYRYKTFSFAY